MMHQRPNAQRQEAAARANTRPVGNVTVLRPQSDPTPAQQQFMDWLVGSRLRTKHQPKQGPRQR